MDDRGYGHGCDIRQAALRSRRAGCVAHLQRHDYRAISRRLSGRFYQVKGDQSARPQGQTSEHAYSAASVKDRPAPAAASCVMAPRLDRRRGLPNASRKPGTQAGCSGSREFRGLTSGCRWRRISAVKRCRRPLPPGLPARRRLRAVPLRPPKVDECARRIRGQNGQCRDKPGRQSREQSLFIRSRFRFELRAVQPIPGIRPVIFRRGTKYSSVPSRHLRQPGAHAPANAAQRGR